MKKKCSSKSLAANVYIIAIKMLFLFIIEYIYKSLSLSSSFYYEKIK